MGRTRQAGPKNRIAELRRVQGTSREELAFRVGVSRETIDNWEAGHTEPKASQVIRMADFFGVSERWLLGIEERRVTNGNGGEAA